MPISLNFTNEKNWVVGIKDWPKYVIHRLSFSIHCEMFDPWEHILYSRQKLSTGYRFFYGEMYSRIEELKRSLNYTGVTQHAYKIASAPSGIWVTFIKKHSSCIYFIWHISAIWIVGLSVRFLLRTPYLDFVCRKYKCDSKDGLMNISARLVIVA